MVKIILSALFCAAISIVSASSLHAMTIGATNFCDENVMPVECLGKTHIDIFRPAIKNELQSVVVDPSTAKASNVFQPFELASYDDIREQIRAKLKTMTRKQILANEQSPWMLGCRSSCACKHMEWNDSRCEGMVKAIPSEEEFKQCNLRCEAYIYLRP